MSAANGGAGSGQEPASGTQNMGQVPTTSSTPATPPAPPSGQVPAPTGGSGSGSGDELTPEQLRDALRKARDEAAKKRVDEKRLAELEKAEADRQAASLTETQKLAQRAEQAEAKLEAAYARIGGAELKAAAVAQGIIDADVAAALLAAKVEYDAAGEPTNIADLVKQLKADKPHLFGQQPGQPGQQPSRPSGASSGGATNPGTGARTGTFTRADLERMRSNPAEYAANRDAIFEALRKGQIRN